MSLREALKSALGSSIVSADEADFHPTFLSTGVAGIDWAGGGGIAEGRLAEVLGPYSSGKSLLLSLLMIENERRNGVNFLGNQEESFDADFYRVLGGDPSKLEIYPNPDQEKKRDGSQKVQQVYLEDIIDIFQQVMRIKVTSGSVEPLVIGWDGIAASVPKAVDIEAPGDHGMKISLSRAVALSHCSMLLFSLVRQSGAVFIATNQCRESPDPFERETRTTGGRSYPYACSQRIELDFGPQIKSEAGSLVGKWIRGKFIKNKAGTPWRQFVMPVYGAFCQHPEYDTETKPGPHKEEALWAFLTGFKSGNSHQLFITAPDGSPYVQPGEGRGYIFHPSIGIPGKFQKGDWMKVLKDNPKVWEIHKREDVK